MAEGVSGLAAKLHSLGSELSVRRGRRRELTATRLFSPFCLNAVAQPTHTSTPPTQ